MRSIFQLGEKGLPMCQNCGKETYPLVNMYGKFVCGCCFQKAESKKQEINNKFWNSIEG